VFIFALDVVSCAVASVLSHACRFVGGGDVSPVQPWPDSAWVFFQFIMHCYACLPCWLHGLVSSRPAAWFSTKAVRSRPLFAFVTLQPATRVDPLPSNTHHRSNGDCLEGKRENYQVCSVQYCSQKLCTMRCTLIWTDLTVLRIGFCLTGPISLCLDSFLGDRL